VKYGKKAFIPIEFVRLADFNSLPPTKLTPEQTAESVTLDRIVCSAEVSG
jgi:eukaryotic translation initiation factor 2C